MKIIKRSGKEDVFDRAKIIAAVGKANITVIEAEQLSSETIAKIASDIETRCAGMNRAVDVETIQDWVEIEIMKYVGATNGLVTLPFVVEGLAMGLISGVLTAAISLGGYSYMVQASDGLGGVWEMIMGQALVPVSAVWSTIIPYSLIGGAVVGGLGSMFSIRKHLNV